MLKLEAGGWRLERISGRKSVPVSSQVYLSATSFILGGYGVTNIWSLTLRPSSKHALVCTYQITILRKYMCLARHTMTKNYLVFPFALVPSAHYPTMV